MDSYLSDEDYTRLIARLDRRLFKKFEQAFVADPALTRPLVSFQANKQRPVYRWYKFKEGFSQKLVKYLVESWKVGDRGKLLDPFAGSGTTLFAASELGFSVDGIELLPVGQEIINARHCAERELDEKDMESLRRWQRDKPWTQAERRQFLNTLRITNGAYPVETHWSIERYLTQSEKENTRVKIMLKLALLCVLESVSYTRKDGQYLRWDHRSGRRSGKKLFGKGYIPSFDEAICQKIDEILSDLDQKHLGGDLFEERDRIAGPVTLFRGSCLDILPTLSGERYDAIVTSPPYCNRYDYTRTYALELALLGTDEQGLAALRQRMLSCTVENREKALMRINPKWKSAVEVADNQSLLQTIIEYLEAQKTHKRLNNNGLPRMVKGYFYEMACVIYECTRVLKKNGLMFVVNDNVRYAGVGISVDMILSDIASELGLRMKKILLLPKGKGNSSQQMGVHGREALRKCVYVWEKQS